MILIRGVLLLVFLNENVYEKCSVSYLYMGHLMIIQVAGCCKPFSTNTTLMWFLPAVNTTMGVQR